MGVTTAEFNALPPTPYSQARPQLRTGDIVLFHSSGVPSELIEHFTGSLWCHAAMVWNIQGDTNRVLLLESVDTFGVRALRMSSKVNGCPPSPAPYPGKLLVVRHKALANGMSDAQAHAMTEFAVDRLGYPYSPTELVKIGLRIAAGLVGETLPGHLQPGNAYVCSEYVAACLKAAGIDLAFDPKGFLAPADIADDPNVAALFSLVPDPAPADADGA
jgi:hypothetical protein